MKYSEEMEDSTESEKGETLITQTLKHLNNKKKVYKDKLHKKSMSRQSKGTKWVKQIAIRTRLWK